jgi:hypothetical protein
VQSEEWTGKVEAIQFYGITMVLILENGQDALWYSTTDYIDDHE